jgi:hypothetical protein
MTPEQLAGFREIVDRATPGPWGPWNANIPFYVQVSKPAPSMSKHDDERPTYWRYEDGLFVSVFNPKLVLELLDEIDRLKEFEWKYESLSK